MPEPSLQECLLKGIKGKETEAKKVQENFHRHLTEFSSLKNPTHQGILSTTMQDSFQNTMPATLSGIWSREEQPCPAKESHECDQGPLSMLQTKQNHVIHVESAQLEDSPVAVSGYIWSHEYSTEQKQKVFKEMLI